jgi:Zn-dependent M28 family amino/carboxypeptidase
MTKNLKRPRKLTFLIIIVLLLGFAYPAGIDAAPAKKQTQKKTSTSAKSTGSSASNRRRSPSRRRSAPTIARKSYDEMMGRSGSVGPGRAVSFGEIGEAEDIALLDETRMRSHIRFLADDLLEGRGTGSRGGLLAAKYIATQFEALGLEPAGMDRSYFQQVHMTGTKTDPSSLLVVRKDTSEAKFRFGDEFVASTDVEEPEVNVIGDLVFVGYGISAPEYNWDDYKGIDVRGKILLMINDPPSTAAEPKLFGGRALTYYGRWTYKFEEAARRGANGVILIHTNETAGYGWNVVKNSFGGERFGLVADDKAQPLRIRGWVTDEAARGLVKIGGLDLNTLRLSAQTRDFRAQALNSHLDTKLKVTSRRLTAPNVAGVLRGSDPNLMNEYVVLTAHWDHLGIRPEQTGDNIYNGAVDNATGVAGMLSVAHWLSSYPTPPKRSVIFLATTAEEQGLLGAEYYTRYPFAPLSKTVATVNLDSMNVLGVTTDISPLGAERSTLGRVVESVARGAGVTITPDPRPEQGGFYRSDHFPFAKAGVPALNFKSGIRYVGHSETWAAEQFKEYNETRYHQPSDEYSPNWDFRGLVQQAKLASLIVSRIANALEIPQWNAGDEFAKARK